MNILFWFMIIVTLTVVNLKPTQTNEFQNNETYRNEVERVIGECQANPATRASDDWLKIQDPATADQYGAHLLCRLTKAGIMKPNGDVDKAGLEKNLLKVRNDPTTVKKIVEKCGVRSPGLTAEQSAVENFRCVNTVIKELL